MGKVGVSSSTQSADAILEEDIDPLQHKMGASECPTPATPADSGCPLAYPGNAALPCFILLFLLYPHILGSDHTIRDLCYGH